MSRHKFRLGQILYYKPGDFAPLQVTAGGRCTVIRLLESLGEECEYGIELESDSTERTVKESELSLPDRPTHVPMSGLRTY